jgi:methanogenic corrinoid protein MtbC1
MCRRPNLWKRSRKPEHTIVGLSGFLTLAYDPMKDTVAALKDAGLDVKIMIGGGQIDEQIRDYTGADAYGRDAMAAVALAKEWA